MLRQIRPGLVRFCSNDIPEPDRIEFVREVYGRVIVKHEIEPYRDSPFHWQSLLQTMPSLGLAWSVMSGLRTQRTPTLVDSDDLVLNVTLAGRRIVRQLGREAIVGPGEVAVTRSAEPGWCEVEPSSRCLNIRVPVTAVTRMIADLDSVLVRTLPSESQHLSLLVSYADIVPNTDVTAAPDIRHHLVGHVHDLVTLVLGATRDGHHMAAGRGLRAARLRAIKGDIMGNLVGLSAATIAARQGITPRHLRRLFEGEGTSFSAFVLEARLSRAHRVLTDPRASERPIGTIAFDAGFGDLSYFNRVFRRRFGATPSDVRAAARREHEN
jgi:AraC-like DNA-binding protein